MVVARGGDGHTEQVLILVHSLDYGREEQQELQVSMGVLPGSSRFSVGVEMLQLLCLPLPFTPSKGFSCNKQAMPWRVATRFIISIVS